MRTAPGQEDVVLECTSGKIQLVDFASSLQEERGGRAAYANQSLQPISNVVKALANRDKHVPYRDSKLMRLFGDMFDPDGNTKTTCICTFRKDSAAPLQLVDSLHTLNFAHTLQRIDNKYSKNVQLTDEQRFQAVQEENKRLRNLLLKYEAATSQGKGRVDYYDLLDEKQDQAKDVSEDAKALQKKCAVLEHRLVIQKMQAEKAKN